MANLSIRGLDEKTAGVLKRSARKRGRSVNAEVLDLVRRGLGLPARGDEAGGHADLDYLAGTWTDQEAAAIARRLEAFEAVDEDSWR